MAQGYGTDVTFVAGADLSTKQFTFVKVSTGGKIVSAGLGEIAVGVLQNKPAADQAATVRVFGKSKLKFAGVVTPGATIKSDADGKGVDASEAVVNTGDAGGATDAVIGSYVPGISTNKANTAANDVGEIFLLHAGIVATTAA